MRCPVHPGSRCPVPAGPTFCAGRTSQCSVSFSSWKPACSSRLRHSATTVGGRVVRAARGKRNRAGEGSGRALTVVRRRTAVHELHQFLRRRLRALRRRLWAPPSLHIAGKTPPRAGTPAGPGTPFRAAPTRPRPAPAARPLPAWPPPPRAGPPSAPCWPGGTRVLHPDSELCTLQSTPCNPHPATHTLHPAICTLHPAIHTLHPASRIHPLHPAIHTLQSAMCTL